MSGSEGGGPGFNRPFLPLSQTRPIPGAAPKERPGQGSGGQLTRPLAERPVSCQLSVVSLLCVLVVKGLSPQYE